MIAATRRTRFIQQLPWFVHDIQRFGPKTQNGPARSKFWAVKKFSQIASSLGSKWSRKRVDHDSYNICHDLYMISGVWGKKTKMALQGANFGPSTNSLKSRRVWAQYRLNVKVIYGLVSKSLDSHCFCIRALVSPGGESWRCWKSNFSTDNFKRTNAKAFS